MSYTTRCPACGTMFRVVPDQLKISDGWVRCGHCADVFDATLHLETWVPPATRTEASKPSPAASRPPPPATPPPPPPSNPSAVVRDPLTVPPGAGLDVDLSEAPQAPLSVSRPVRRETRTLVDAASGASAPSVGAMPARSALVKRRAPSDPALDRTPLRSPRADTTTAASLPPVRDFDVTMPMSLEDELDLSRERVPAQVSSSTPAAAVVPPAAASDGSRAPDAASPSQTGPLTEEPDFLAELQQFAAKASKDESTAAVNPPEFRLKRSVVKAQRQSDPSKALSSPSAAPAAQFTPRVEEEQAQAMPPAEAPHESAPPSQVGDATDPAASGPGAEPESELPPPLPAEPEFIQQARRRAYWQTPGMRALLSVVALALASLLAAQWALFERNRLVAWKPDLQPAFQAVCSVLGCTLEPVQRIDAVVIDSTALVRRLGNFYSFDLVLKNTAAISVAVPALELSLTDASDNVISRRVFLPQDLPAVPQVLAAGRSLSVSLRLSIAVGDSLPMSGYRALVFYP